MDVLFRSFQNALEALKDALKEEKTAITRDAAIQRFEFTAELSWKCIQKFLGAEHIICRSLRECLKDAFKFGLVKDDAGWLKIFEDRNLTVHTYSEDIADEIYGHFGSYIVLFEDLKGNIEKRIALRG